MLHHSAAAEQLLSTTGSCYKHAVVHSQEKSCFLYIQYHTCQHNRRARRAEAADSAAAALHTAQEIQQQLIEHIWLLYKKPVASRHNLVLPATLSHHIL